MKPSGTRIVRPTAKPSAGALQGRRPESATQGIVLWSVGTLLGAVGAFSVNWPL